MADHRLDVAHGVEGFSDGERDARIERLLLAGLEDYFAGRLEQAINVWTRVLFLDRANDRARAYIDRARRAQAERQRESEALVHQGLQAFDEGDVDEARRLLTTAVERGAAHEEALPVLHRIGLLDVQSAGREPTAPATGRWRQPPVPGNKVTASVWGPSILVVAALAVAAVVLAGVGGDANSGVTAVPTGAQALPVPGAFDASVDRAERLYRAGKLSDALITLDRITPADARFDDAQALRAHVQRALLDAVPGLGRAPAETSR